MPTFANFCAFLANGLNSEELGKQNCNSIGSLGRKPLALVFCKLSVASMGDSASMHQEKRRGEVGRGGEGEKGGKCTPKWAFLRQSLAGEA